MIRGEMTCSKPSATKLTSFSGRFCRARERKRIQSSFSALASAISLYKSFAVCFRTSRQIMMSFSQPPGRHNVLDLYERHEGEYRIIPFFLIEYNAYAYAKIGYIVGVYKTVCFTRPLNCYAIPHTYAK